METEIQHDKKNGKFSIELEGENAELKYRKLNDDTVLDMYSTYVPEPHRGQGLAGKLAQSALDYALESDYRVKPSCPYIANFIEKNPAYESLLVKE